MKAEKYLETNPVVANFIADVNTLIREYYETHLSNLTHRDVVVSVGNKFVKIVHGGSVWGFISRYDGVYKGQPIKRGDLMKAASYASPAKHSRGNIVDGTAKYGVHGANYLI